MPGLTQNMWRSMQLPAGDGLWHHRLSPSWAALSEHGQLRTITEQAPHLARLLWLDALDGHLSRVETGEGQAIQDLSLAHLVCELFIRLQVVKRTGGMSSAAFASGYGRRVRALRDSYEQGVAGLRKSNAVIWTNHLVAILDWDRLAAIA